MAMTMAAYGQEYPTKPIRLVTSPAGGGGDILARLIAQGISTPLKQQVIVDNRAANLVGESVAQAPGDGYTLLLLGNVLWLEPLTRKTRYDVAKDFRPVSMVGMSPNVLVVHPSLPVKTVKDLITLSKARPGELNYATSGAGSVAELCAELFDAMAGVRMTAIPYKGASIALNSLMGGEVHLMFVTAPSATAHISSGRLRALALTSARESALVPGLTTISAAGLPGYELVSFYGVFAPAQTPAAYVKRLNEEIVHSVTTAETKKKFLDVGVEATGTSPEELGDAVRADVARIGKVVKSAAAAP